MFLPRRIILSFGHAEQAKNEKLALLRQFHFLTLVKGWASPPLREKFAILFETHFTFIF